MRVVRSQRQIVSRERGVTPRGAHRRSDQELTQGERRMGRRGGHPDRSRVHAQGRGAIAAPARGVQRDVQLGDGAGRGRRQAVGAEGQARAGRSQREVLRQLQRVHQHAQRVRHAAHARVRVLAAAFDLPRHHDAQHEGPAHLQRRHHGARAVGDGAHVFIRVRAERARDRQR